MEDRPRIILDISLHMICVHTQMHTQQHSHTDTLPPNMCTCVQHTKKKTREGKGAFKRDGRGDTWLGASHRYLNFGLSMTVGVVIGCLQVLAVSTDATLAYGGWEPQRRYHWIEV